jgi:hypothetical protein
VKIRCTTIPHYGPVCQLNVIHQNIYHDLCNKNPKLLAIRNAKQNSRYDIIQSDVWLIKNLLLQLLNLLDWETTVK